MFAVHFLVFHVSAADNPKEQYRKLQKEMAKRREKIERAKKREHSTLEELDEINKKVNAVEVAFRKQKTRINQIEAEVKKVEGDISENMGSIEKGKILIKRKLQAMQKYGESRDSLIILAGAEDFPAFMRRWKYLETVALYERRIIAGYAVHLSQLEEKEAHLKVLRTELKKEEDRIKVIAESQKEKRREKSELLASLKKETSENEKLLRELQESSKRLLDIIKRLDEKETYAGKGFEALRGKLPWPVNGKLASPYGRQRDSKFNTPVFRNGIYISTEDTSAKAVYDGKVVFADWFKGYGNLLIINHGDGHHTLYANLSEIFLKVGDIIKTSSIIGRVGESGVLNAPSLYFEIRYKGKPLDPMQWLKRK